jgi:BlaI family penicillinase repressor
MARKGKAALSPLENAVMRVLWERRQATAEDVRQSLAADQELKDSTVRTILRRLEAKGYATHTLDGRTFVYAPQIERRSVAADAVRKIMDRFCNGSVENLLVGLVDDEVISPQKLKQLADRINRAEAKSSEVNNKKRPGSTKRR